MYLEANLDVFTRSIEMIKNEDLSFLDCRDSNELICKLEEKRSNKLLKLLPPFAIFHKMQNIQQIKEIGLTEEEYFTILDGFTFWGDYETSLALIKKNNLCEKETLIKVFCFLGQNKFRQALKELLKITKFYPEQVWKYIFVCAIALDDENYLEKSLKNLQKFYYPAEYLVFGDLALLKEIPSNRSGSYLFFCWQMMFCFLQLNIIDKFKMAFNLAKKIDYEKTIYAVIFSCWSAGKEITSYLSMLKGKENWKYLNIIKADYYLEQGKTLEAWYSFKIALACFPEDIIIKNGIAFAALLEGEKIGKKALEFFTLSDLIQERVQFIEQEKPNLFERYRFLVMYKKKERKILQRLLIE